MKNKTAILIPSYNETKAIGEIVTDLVRAGMTVYVVDDGSTDDTASIARSCGAVVIAHGENRGKGASLKSGFRQITDDGFQYALAMDGDGQHHTEDVDRFFEAMTPKTGIVIGNRMTDTRAMPFLRIATNRLMSLIISLVTGQEIPDTQCGFRLVRTELFSTIDLTSSNFEADSELLIKVARRGWKIASVPIHTIYGDETSRIRPFRDTLRFLALMCRIPFDKR